MKRIYRPIRCNTELLAKQYTADYLSRQNKSESEPIDSSVKRLINKYSEDIIAPSGSISTFIRQAGPGLLEYLMERVDITKQMIPSIFSYFVNNNHQVVAGRRER